MSASRSGRSSARHPAVRWAAVGLVALLVVGLVAGVAASIAGNDGESSSSATTLPTSGDGTDSTVPRDGDPEFCAAIADFQTAYLTVAEPGPSATPAQVEASWDELTQASAAMIETAPQDMAAFTLPVVSAFDVLRQDAQAAGFSYTTFDDLDSSATIDPDGTIAQSAYALFSYGEDRCPLPAGGDATTTTIRAD